LVEFGSFVEQSKSLLEMRGFFSSSKRQPPGETQKLDLVRSTIKRILGAELIRIQKQDFLQFDDGRRVKLAQASSGQQEALPLLLLLARFIQRRHVQGRAVYIEEPEAHLYPVTQKLIVELMARAFRARESQMLLIITTHSPYILTSVNNLLQAGRLYDTVDSKAKTKLDRIIPESSSFKPGEVAFFALEDGHATSILDPETGLIDASAIDQVSTDIATQFDELLAEAHEKS
jgi:hypothetical protein